MDIDLDNLVLDVDDERTAELLEQQLQADEVSMAQPDDNDCLSGACGV